MRVVRGGIETARATPRQVLLVGLRAALVRERRRPRSRPRACTCARTCARGVRPRSRASRAASRSAAPRPARATPRPRGCSSGWRRDGSGRAAARVSSKRDDLRGRRLRLAVLGPVVPRRQVHQRFGEERLRVEVVGILLRERAHLRRRRRGRARRGPRPSRRSSAQPRAVDVGLLARRHLRGERLRARDRGHGRRYRVRIHRHVDVRTERNGHAPGAHRAGRVEPCSRSRRRGSPRRG